MSTVLLVCETCGYDEQSPDAVRKGELLACALEDALSQRGQDTEGEVPAIRIKRYKCLMACKRHCVVQLRSTGKLGYVIGDFKPDALAVSTLIDYSYKFHHSETGQVPYKEWPDAIKGKFVARIPPLENI